MAALADYDESLVKYIFGDFGQHFLSFSRKVYDDHPSLADINHGTLLKGGVVYDRVIESLQWAKYAKANGFQQMPPVLQRWFNRNHDSIIKVFRKPPARIVKGAGDRRDMRVLSKHKEIDLMRLYEKGRRDTWDSLPSSFVPYCRMGPGFQDEIALYERLGKHVKSLGMSSTQKCVGDDIQRFDELLSDQYMGFIRVKLADAAMVAAKAMGAQWSNSRSSRIYVSAKHFTRAFWACDAGDKLADDPMLSDVFDGRVVVEANYLQKDGSELRLSFSPRAYPVDRFDVARPSRVKKILDTLDNHVDANGHALFDNYWVVVPGITYQSGARDTYEFRDTEKVYRFYEYWEYAKALDRYLVETGQIFPVLLGEHVSRKACYFISYWA